MDTLNKSKDKLAGAIASANANTSTGGKIFYIVLFLSIIWFIYSRYSAYRRNNPVWFRNGYDAKKEFVIPDKFIIRPKDITAFTYHTFVYISEWDYNIFWFKVLFYKQNSVIAYLEPIKNNLIISVRTEKGNDIATTIEDFPIKRWTHLAIVCNEVSLEVYIGGLLAQTVNLDSPVAQSPLDLKICPWGGFSGFLSKFCYVPRAIPSREIYTLSRRPLFDWKWFSITLKNLNICGMGFGVPTEADMENVNEESLSVFGKLQGSMNNLKDVSSSLYSKMESRGDSAANNRKYDAKLSCPNINDAPLCPIGTLACKDNQRYCYYPDRDVMVSTYMSDKYDYCPEEDRGNKDGSKPFEIGGVRVWQRQGGKDTRTCTNMK